MKSQLRQCLLRTTSHYLDRLSIKVQRKRRGTISLSKQLAQKNSYHYTGVTRSKLVYYLNFYKQRPLTYVSGERAKNTKNSSKKQAAKKR